MALKAVFVVVAVCVLMLGLAEAAPADIFSAGDAAAMAAGLPTGGSLAERDWASQAFLLLKQTPPKALCEGLSGASTMAEAAHLVSLVGAVGCKKTSTKAAASLLKGGVADNVVDLYYQAHGLASLEGTSKQLNAVLDAIVALSDDDGTFKVHADDEYGSIWASGYGLAGLATVAKHTTLDGAAQDQLDVVFEVVPDLLSLAEGPSDGAYLAFLDADAPSVDPLLPTALVVDGALGVAQALGQPVPFTAAQTNGFAEYFIMRKAASTGADAFAVLSGLQAVANNGEHSPVVVRMASPSVDSADSKAEVEVSVTDLFGGAVPGVQVMLQRAVAQQHPSVVLLSGLKLSAVSGGDGTVFSFDFMSTKPSAGYYAFEFTVKTKSGGPYIPVSSSQQLVKVMAPIAMAKCKVGVVQDDVGGGASSSFACNSGDVLSADEFQKLTFAFRVNNAVSKKAVSPHQVFVRFVSDNAKAPTPVFVATHGTTGYTLTVDLAAVAEEFESVSGVYTAEAVVGDAFASNALLAPLGQFSLAFAHVEYEAPVDPFAVKPDIVHQFRAPAPRPSSFISLVFTGLVLVPLGALIVYLMGLGVNVANFPTGSLSIDAIAFHSAILAIMLLYVTYWLKLNMFDTLSYLALLGVCAIFFGQRLLSGHSAFRSESLKVHAH